MVSFADWTTSKGGFPFSFFLFFFLALGFPFLNWITNKYLSRAPAWSNSENIDIAWPEDWTTEKGKRISKSFEGPEGTQKNLAELEVLRNWKRVLRRKLIFIFDWNSFWLYEKQRLLSWELFREEEYTNKSLDLVDGFAMIEEKNRNQKKVNMKIGATRRV